MALEKGGCRGVFQELFTRKEGERRRGLVVGILLQCHSAMMIYKVPTQSVEISGVLLRCVDGVESAPGLRVC